MTKEPTKSRNEKKLLQESAVVPEVLPPDETDSLPPTEFGLDSHYKDFSWRDGAEIIADAADCIPGVGRAIKAFMGLGDYSPEERLKDKQFSWLIKQIPLIQKKLDVLLDKLPLNEQPEPADVASILEAALDTSQKTAEARKRKLLRNAVVNSFSPQQYQEGLTLRLFSILKQVEYGDVELLRELAKKEGVIEVRSISNAPRGGLLFHHLDILIQLDLVVVWNQDRGAPLSISTINAQAIVSELGRKFIAFVADESVGAMDS